MKRTATLGAKKSKRTRAFWQPVGVTGCYEMPWGSSMQIITNTAEHRGVCYGLKNLKLQNSFPWCRQQDLRWNAVTWAVPSPGCFTCIPNASNVGVKHALLRTGHL